jgi:hypothetical protein
MVALTQVPVVAEWGHAIKRALLFVVLPIVLGHAGCSLFHAAARPAAYGAELAACEAQSTTWSEYSPCCTDVARRYGRDPSFCFPDGGP